MTAPPLLKVALLASVWWPAVRPVPCGLSIHPVDPIVPFGGSVTLNCTSSCANNTQLNWEMSTQGEVHEADSWTSVSFVNMTVWDFQPVCYGDASENPLKMPIYLYQFSSPAIYLVSAVESGSWHTVICNISSLKVRGQFPQNISISLCTGEHILNSSQGISWVEYTSVAQVDQDGAEILCVAQLEVGSEVLEKRTSGTLNVSARPHNINVTSSVTSYKAGSSITVTCHADGKPFPEFTWDLPSVDNVAFSDNNRTVTIHSAQSPNNGTYQCHAQNTYGKTSAHIDILYEGKCRNWVTTVVVVVVLVLVASVFGICYLCRK